MADTYHGPESLVLNGIDADTGNYLVPPRSLGEIARLIAAEVPGQAQLEALATHVQATREPHLGLVYGLSPAALDQAGWGLVLPARAPADPILEALRPLLELRRQQAGERRYRVYTGDDGCRPGESGFEWLARHCAVMGAVDPDKVPYYLLLLGPPNAIPFEFQYELDVNRAVGRLDLARYEELAVYSAAVVAAEAGSLPVARRVAFYGTRHEADLATQLSADELIVPLADHVREQDRGWKVECRLADQATKPALAELLGGSPAALLLTASHGVGFPCGDPRQLGHQGALLCQEWPGREAGPLRPEHYYAAADLSPEPMLHGMVAIHFACYGGGTPEEDQVVAGPNPAAAARVAPEPFTARLPQQLLARGALAVVAHVDRAWSCAFRSPDGEPQLGNFRSLLSQLMDGLPVGAAMEQFGESHASLAVSLEHARYKRRCLPGLMPDDRLVGLWTASRDARSYAVFGDPAARLPVGRKE